MRRIQSVLVLCVAFLFAIGPQSSIAGPYSTTEVLPVHTWSGLYLGANLGGAWGSTTAYDNNGINAASDYWSWGPSGFTGGVQLGYNWQLGPVLYGLEGDLGELGLGGSATQAYVPFIYNTSTGTDIDFYLTLRGRLGILFNQSLLYATLGYIGADTTASVVTACTFPPCTVAVNAQNESFRNGWTVGGGFETVISGQWTVKLEYLYFDFGSVNVSGVSNANSYSWTLDTDGSLVRVGLNYQFGYWNGY
ncbi:MAG: outer membrane protein [Hyphomicrobium sp.]